jgi:hypothetical protein
MPSKAATTIENTELNDRHTQAPAAGHAARRDHPVRLVDGVDMTVEPVIDRLAGATQQRSGEQNHARATANHRSEVICPAEIAPQAKAHIGGNQVTGLSRASTAPGVGTLREAGVVCAMVMTKVYDRETTTSIQIDSVNVILQCADRPCRRVQVRPV